MADVERFREHLEAAGFESAESASRGESFGSWYITLKGTPTTELVWDGKDGWLILRRGGLDVWIARDAESQTPEAVDDALREHS